MNYKILTFCFFVLLNTYNLISQSDASGCKDHEIITRYPGAVIEYCDFKNHNDYSIATGPESGYRKIDKWVNVSGKQTRIYYSIKGSRTINEIYQNYTSALKKDDFEFIASKLHSERNVSTDIGGNTWLVTYYKSNPFPSNLGIKINQGSGSLGGTFYIAANKGNVYVVVSGKKYSDDESVILVDIIETHKLEDDLIKVNSKLIAEMLFKKGRIALEGILFDHNKATIKAESKPILDEIATFLTSNPSTTVFIVGHTDMTGDFKYNIDLSFLRAEAIVNELINNYKIQANRLFPNGVGPLAPVSDNNSEEGRTKNRRVELVLKSK